MIFKEWVANSIINQVFFLSEKSLYVGSTSKALHVLSEIYMFSFSNTMHAKLLLACKILLIFVPKKEKKMNLVNAYRLKTKNNSK